ncbi:MAG: hypothetical protein ACOCS7_03140 [Halolamina sp.]
MSDETTRSDRRDEYHQVLGIVEANTGGRQRPLARVASVKQTAIQAGVTDPRGRVRAAVEQGDLLRVGDRVVRTNEDDLRTALDELNEQRQRVLAALEEVRVD